MSPLWKVVWQLSIILKLKTFCDPEIPLLNVVQKMYTHVNQKKYSRMFEAVVTHNIGKMETTQEIINS
jgi:hypothetical protein